MADDKSKTRTADRSKVAAEEPYELTYFARKHGLTLQKAAEILTQSGPSRKAADAAAERRKGR